MVSEKTIIGDVTSKANTMGSVGGMTFTHGNLLL
jgi:hypothetical protein